jgi:hypothetical protein
MASSADREDRAAPVAVAARLLARTIGGDLLREGEDFLVPAIPHQQISKRYRPARRHLGYRARVLHS